MKNHALILLFIGLLSFSNIFAQSIDKEKSVVNFKISNMRVNTVKGTFNEMTGSVNFDPLDVANSSFDVCVDASTVNTGIKNRDTNLKEEEYFHVEKYPNICFRSTSITKAGSTFRAKGSLTMRGVTKQVEIPFTYENNAFTGTVSLKRYDYKIGEDTGTFMMANKVDITIVCHVK